VPPAAAQPPPPVPASPPRAPDDEGFDDKIESFLKQLKTFSE
jgi:hypothetical protein